MTMNNKIHLHLTLRSDKKFIWTPPIKDLDQLEKISLDESILEDEYWADIEDDTSYKGTSIQKLIILDNPFSFLPPNDELNVLNTLTPIQFKALKQMVEIAKQESDKCLSKISVKCKGDMNRVLQYIRDQAPIIIHINPLIICNHMKSDPNYRNKFEVSKQHCNSRFSWESRMFSGMYDKALPEERVKYGVLNILNDPYGVKACYSYGDCYLLLKRVRLRTSFSDQDTSSQTAKIASCEHYAHVLDQYNDLEFESTMKVALGKSLYEDSKIISVYKEIQIHGKVNLKDHVEAIVMNPRYKKSNNGIIKGIEKVAKDNGCKLIWMDELKSELDLLKSNL